MAGEPNKQVIIYADLASGINPLYVLMASEAASRHGRAVKWHEDRLSQAYISASGIDRSIGGLLLISNDIGPSPEDPPKTNWWSLPRNGFGDRTGLTVAGVMRNAAELDLGVNIGLVTENAGRRIAGRDQHYQVPTRLNEHHRDSFTKLWIDNWFKMLPEPPALHLVTAQEAYNAEAGSDKAPSTPKLEVVEGVLVA